MSKKVNINIPGWAVVAAALILVVGLGIVGINTTQATGRFNLPLSWILTPAGSSVDSNNDGVINNAEDADTVDGSHASAFQEDLQTNDCGAGYYLQGVTDAGGVTCATDTNANTECSGTDTFLSGDGTCEPDSYATDTDTHGSLICTSRTTNLWSGTCDTKCSNNGEQCVETTNYTKHCDDTSFYADSWNCICCVVQ